MQPNPDYKKKYNNLLVGIYITVIILFLLSFKWVNMINSIMFQNI